MPRLLFLAGVLAASFAAGFALAEPAPPTVTAPVAADAAAPVSSEYRIGRDDTLQIAVFQVPELSQTVKVDANGEIMLPMVGRVAAAGHSASELAEILRSKLDGRYLRDPQVTVVVKEAISQRVTVNGAVVQPGVFPLSGPTSLVQAVALAKGADAKVANQHRVAIFRNVEGRRQAQIYDLTQIEKGATPDPMVQADDIVVVESSGPRSFITYFGSTLTLLALIHP
jgi:polysaccharide export outer membrane protein